MDFSLTTIFVNPVGSTLASAGATSALTPGKIGFFKKTYAAPAVAADTEFVIAQGRMANEIPQTTKKSDVIRNSKVIRYKKFPAVTAFQPKIIEISDFTARCGEEVSITLRTFSKYLRVSYFNGMTNTFTIQTPCCECGEDPCTEVDAEALVDEFITKINASKHGEYLTASKTGTGADAVLVLTGDALQQDPNSVNLDNYVYDGFDYTEFYAYAYKGAETTMDELVANRCEVFATVETTQTPTFPRGSYAEVRQMEKRFYSYQSGIFKMLNCNPDWNPVYTPHAVPGTYYDQYLIKFRTTEGNKTWGQYTEQDETVILYVAQADSAAYTTALDALMKAGSIETEY